MLHLIGVALHEQKRAIEAGNQDYDFLSRACGQAKESGKSKKGDIMTLILTWLLKAV